MRQLVSIIIPCYNEEDVIEETFLRLNEFCHSVDEYDFELVFVDDGSYDETKRLLSEKSYKFDYVKVIVFARNFGHQIAVTAGIDAAMGDALVIIDADLQDPPEVIHHMLDKWQKGYDVVYGTRSERYGESLFKRTTAHWFYRIINLLANIPIPLDTGDFRLITRRVADAFKSMPEHDRFVRGMISWVGFRQIGLPYERAERFAGTTKYPLRKMVGFALDGILSFTTQPLRLAIGLGVVCAGAAFIGILYALFLRLFTSIWVEGWTALMIAVLFIGGVQLVSVGILGEYIGRIYTQVKNRPLYVVESRYGFNESGEKACDKEGGK